MPVLWHGGPPGQRATRDSYSRPWAPDWGGRTPRGLLGALERERGGVAGAGVRPRSSPFPALQRACALVGVWRLEVPWWRNPHGPLAGALPRAGPAKLSLWDVLGGDETAGPWLRRGGSRAACGGSRAGAWRGCGRWGSPPLFPVPGPAACLRAGGRLAPRGSVMTEPPRAAGGRLAEGWAPEYWLNKWPGCLLLRKRWC